MGGGSYMSKKFDGRLTTRDAAAIEDIQRMITAHMPWAPRYKREHFFALALAGEAGELANIYKKDWRGGGKKISDAAVSDKINGEIVDVIAYALMLAAKRKLPVWHVLLKKLHEVEERPEFKAGLKARRAMRNVAKARKKVKIMRANMRRGPLVDQPWEYGGRNA